MSRSIDASIITAMAADTFSPLFLFEVYFDSGNLFLWNGYGEITLDGRTYTGASTLLTVGETRETTSIEARGQTVSLTGIPSSLVALALAEPYQGRKCISRIGYEGGSAVAILFSGKLDQMNIEEGGGTVSITVTIESDLAVLDRTVPRYYTSASQKSRYPNDKAFNFVTNLGNRPLNWGGGR